MAKYPLNGIPSKHPDEISVFLVAICLSAPLQALAFISQTANLWIYIYIYTSLVLYLQCLLIIFSIGNLKVNETRIKVLARGAAVSCRTQKKKRDEERERKREEGRPCTSTKTHVCVYWWRSNLKEIRPQRRGEASTFSSIKAIIARASLFEQETCARRRY